MERCFALLCAFMAVMMVGSLFEAKSPELMEHASKSLPCALCIAACWTLVDWRQSGGHTAWSTAGRSPWIPVFSLMLCAAPLLGLASMARGIPEGQLHVTPERVTVRTQAGLTEFKWADGNAQRIDPNGKSTTTQKIPAPTGTSNPTPSSGIAHSLPGLALFGALCFVGFRRQNIGFSATLCVAGLAFVGGEFLRYTFLSL